MSHKTLFLVLSCLVLILVSIVFIQTVFTNSTSNNLAAVALTTPDPMTTASRTSGVAPLAVFFDAVNTASPVWTSGVIQPADGDYASFQYNWDFGDVTAGNWSTGRQNPDGSYPSKNQATGYVSAHVFETPGTYTVKLNITDTTGAIHEYTQTITVTDPNVVFAGTNTRCVSTSGNFVGCPAGASNIASSDFAAQVNWVNGASGRRLLFRRGESWTVNEQFDTSVNGPNMIGDFGTGNKPQLSASPGLGDVMLRADSHDWRFVNLKMVHRWDRVQEYNANAVLVTGGNALHTLFSRVDATRWGLTGYGMSYGDCSFLYESTATDGAWVGMYASHPRRIAVLGTQILDTIGNGGSIVGSHNIYTEGVAKGIFSHNLLENPGYWREGLRIAGDTSYGWGANYIVINDNEVKLGATGAIGFDLSPNVDNDQEIHNLLVERNHVYDAYLTDDVSVFIGGTKTSDITVKNNLFEAGIRIAKDNTGSEDGPKDIKILNNHIFALNSQTTHAPIIKFSDQFKNVELKNNVFHSKDSSTVEGIYVVDQSKLGNLVSNNNLFYIPNSNRVAHVGTQYRTMAEWKALGFDLQGIDTDTSPFVAYPTDFHLSSSSPAKDSGINLAPWVRTDFDLTSRPQGSGFDIGAYEYHNDTPIPGTLSVTPTTDFTTSGFQGGPFTPSSKVYTLTNSGSTDLNWTLTKTVPWLTLSLSGGTLVAGATTPVTVTTNSSATILTPGTYPDTLTFTNTTNGNGNTTRVVSLTVNSPAGVLSVTPASSFTTSGTVGGPFTPVSQTYTLTNSGNQPINWSVSKTQPWLTLSKASGSLSAGATDTVTTSINSSANSLAPGPYSDVVTFTNLTNGNGNTVRPVSLTVNTQPTGGLVLHLPFDGNLNDISGNHNDGTCSGSDCPTATSGHAGGAYLFDGGVGTAHRLQVPDSSSLKFTTNQLTISAWVKPQTISGDHAIISKFRGTTKDLYLFASNGNVDFTLGGSPTTNDWPTGITLSPNQWTHLALSYDGTIVRAYQDGEPRAVTPGTGGSLGLPSNQNSLQLGYDTAWPPNEEPWSGAIDEVQLYDRALSASEIHNLYSGTTCLTGDTNNDGLINFADINPFVWILTHLSQATPIQLCAADVNNDGTTDFSDINAMVALLSRLGIPVNQLQGLRKLPETMTEVPTEKVGGRR